MNKNGRLFLALLACIVLLINGCGMDYSNYMLKIKNRSSRNISVLYNNGEKEPENNVAYYIASYNIVQPDSSYTIFIPGNGDAWHDYIQHGKSKKLFIYVFDADNLNRYKPWVPINYVLNAHEYLQKLEFTEEQLIKSNWNITFNAIEKASTN